MQLQSMLNAPIASKSHYNTTQTYIQLFYSNNSSINIQNAVPQYIFVMFSNLAFPRNSFSWRLLLFFYKPMVWTGWFGRFVGWRLNAIGFKRDRNKGKKSMEWEENRLHHEYRGYHSTMERIKKIFKKITKTMLLPVKRWGGELRQTFHSSSLCSLFRLERSGGAHATESLCC